MNIKNALRVILFAICVLVVGACKDTWDEHTEILANESKITLLERIAAEPSLSKFYGYIVQTGLDSSLSSSKTYTVWAPDNSAIDALIAQDASYLADPVKLKDFVKYHIANLIRPSVQGSSYIRLKTLMGLSVSVSGNNYEEAVITKRNQYAKNGVLHIVNAALKVKPSLFLASLELTTNVNGTSQGDDMRALDTLIGAEIKRSPKWASIVSKLSEQDSLYTFFVLENNAYDNEKTKILPYYKSNRVRPDSTQSYFTKVTMLENLLVRGLYTIDQLPDTLVSVAGTKMPVKKSAIVSSYKTNNGIVYVLNELPYRLKDRIREFKIEGEKPSSLNFSRPLNTFYRAKLDSLGKIFYDIEVWNSGLSNAQVTYIKPEVHTARYDVYVRSVSGVQGDPQTTAFTQRFGLSVSQIFFTHVVNPRRYSEVYLGQYTVAQYGPLTWRLISANTSSQGANTMILDYLRFVPVLPN
ncbi:MAG: fasciclin domain-containing protein [Sphingobacteriaceae bacterium]|nr:fasciclin domain-containing protein [Sphingobacteriaceae bacterium]